MMSRDTEAQITFFLRMDIVAHTTTDNSIREFVTDSLPLNQILNIKTMATITTNYAHHAPETTTAQVHRVATILKWTYGLVPILAGADKFTHILTDWDKYLAPVITDIIPLSPATFMSIVGIIEIIAGILVFIRPKIGSLVVGLWLIGIAINLLLTGQYFDIAVRDIVMAIGAFSLSMLVADHRTHE
jgi:uncharacterized membrane protein YphA (DoxX/SURF4 family)